MARVEILEEKEISRPSRHKTVEASFSIVEVDGERVLQIDSYGSPDRVLPGKVSQSLQFGPSAAKQLYEILLKEFGA